MRKDANEDLTDELQKQIAEVYQSAKSNWCNITWLPDLDERAQDTPKPSKEVMVNGRIIFVFRAFRFVLRSYSGIQHTNGNLFLHPFRWKTSTFICRFYTAVFPFIRSCFYWNNARMFKILPLLFTCWIQNSTGTSHSVTDNRTGIRLVVLQSR